MCFDFKIPTESFEDRQNPNYCMFYIFSVAICCYIYHGKKQLGLCTMKGLAGGMFPVQRSSSVPFFPNHNYFNLFKPFGYYLPPRY